MSRFAKEGVPTGELPPDWDAVAALARRLAKVEEILKVDLAAAEAAEGHALKAAEKERAEAERKARRAAREAKRAVKEDAALARMQERAARRAEHRRDKSGDADAEVKEPKLETKTVPKKKAAKKTAPAVELIAPEGEAGAEDAGK